MLIDHETYVPGKAGEAKEELPKLKPSQAIRIGAAMRPQCIGDFFVNGRSCALGAMWEGFGERGEPPRANLDWVQSFGLPHELACSAMNNNDMGWTRERVADWLESKGY